MITPPDASSGGDDSAETVQVPVAYIGGAQVGDTVTMKVVSRDDEAGTASLMSMDNEPAEAPGGTDGMADEFSKANIQQTA